jgi:hypothetical protein
MPVRLPWTTLLAVLLAAGCGRTELEVQEWHDYDAGRPEIAPPDGDVPDVPPDVEPDVAPDDAPVPDVPPDADAPEFVGMSCMSAALCAMCCGGDYLCMMDCVSDADPSSRGQLMDIVGCITGSGCGGIGGTPDLACIMEECRSELDACTGGPGGTGGCLSLAWCLVSTGCASVAECAEQGLCYQTCFGAARPAAVGAARDLVVCIAGVCMESCASGLTSTDCLVCMGSNCLIALRGCIGF